MSKVQNPQKDQAKVFKKRACLSGSDLVSLLRGEMIVAHGVEFVYDGSNERAVHDAIFVLARGK